MAANAIPDLTEFKHLERPKDWNVPGMKALFELLHLGPGQAHQVALGERAPVQELQSRIEKAVEGLLRGPRPPHRDQLLG